MPASNTRRSAQLLDFVDYIKQPIPLLQIKGLLFDFSTRKPKKLPKNPLRRPTREEFKRDPQMSAAVFFDDVYGPPKQMAYRIWLAIEKSLSHDSKKTTFYLTKIELLQIAEIKIKGGSGVVALERALHQLRRTDIWYRSVPFLDNKKNQIGHFQLIDWKRDIKPGNSDQECYVITVHPIIARLYKRKKLLNWFNHALMADLSPTKHCFATILNYRLTIRYQVARRKKTIDWDYTISYQGYLEWIFGAAIYTSKSTIEDNQLHPKTQHLVERGLLAQLPRLERPVINGVAQKTGWNVVFTPGSQFFDDYHRSYGKKPIDVEALDDRSAPGPSPEHPALNAEENKSTETPTDVDQVLTRFNRHFSPDKKIRTTPTAAKFAQRLIDEFGLERALSFIEWGVRKAAHSFAEMKVIGGLVNYIDDFKRDSSPPKPNSTQETEREIQENKELQANYDRYCRSSIQSKIAEMSGAETMAFNTQVAAQVEAAKGQPGTKDSANYTELIQIQELVKAGLLHDFPIWRQIEQKRLKAIKQKYA